MKTTIKNIRKPEILAISVLLVAFLSIFMFDSLRTDKQPPSYLQTVLQEEKKPHLQDHVYQCNERRNAAYMATEYAEKVAAIAAFRATCPEDYKASS